MHPRARGDAGAGSVELAVIAAVLVTLVMIVIQGAIYFHARAVVATAARAGVDNARIANGTDADGVAAVHALLDGSSGEIRLSNVDVHRQLGEVTVTVSASVVSLVPGVSGWSTEVTYVAPVEQVTP